MSQPGHKVAGGHTWNTSRLELIEEPKQKQQQLAERLGINKQTNKNLRCGISHVMILVCPNINARSPAIQSATKKLGCGTIYGLSSKMQLEILMTDFFTISC